MFVSWGWRRSESLALALPAQKAAALAGFLAAFAYCLISGYAVPAQRTLYMVGVVALGALARARNERLAGARPRRSSSSWCSDPWAVLSPGFWLSFAAVGGDFLRGVRPHRQSHWLAQWGRVQWAVTVGLAPLLLVLFQQVSLVSPPQTRSRSPW